MGTAAQDDILVTVMLWAIDYRDFPYALRLAAHAIRFHLVMPGFTRSVACIVAEEIAGTALAQAEAVDHDTLLQTLALVTGADMPDPVMAKLYKAIGRSFARKADAFDPAADNAPAGGKAAYVEAALNTLSRALVLDRAIGVKKDIERLERQQKALAETAPDFHEPPHGARGADGGQRRRLADKALPTILTPENICPLTKGPTMTGVIAVPAMPLDPVGAQVVADGWFPPVSLNALRDTVRLGNGVVTTPRLISAIEGGMLHAFRELADWRSARAAAGIASLDQVTDQTLNGANLAVKLWERIVIYFAASDLYAGNRDISATDQGLDRALEKDTAADEARRVALAAVADLRSSPESRSVATA
jgi:hypothetical protein